MAQMEMTESEIEQAALEAHLDYSRAFMASTTRDLDKDPKLNHAYHMYWNARDRAGLAIARETYIFFPPELVLESAKDGVAISTFEILLWIADRCEADDQLAMAHFYRYVAYKYYPLESEGVAEDEEIGLDVEALE